jgi:putative oxygen-independent coproporphyrinogen III oxidase
MNKTLGLYLHIPFCRSKCAYCDFYSVTDDELAQRYADALILHMEDYREAARSFYIDTLYMGGGTPTSLPKKMLLDIIDGIYGNFNVLQTAEFTVECNPATADRPLLSALHRAGVNRLSIGIQSACDNELRNLTRIHTFDEAVETYEAARKAKFENISVDLMYGIPEQTERSLAMSLESIVELDPEHISLYGLKIEPYTPFADNADRLSLPDEDTEYRMYESAVHFLESHGYRHYEISNFAKPGMECAHNMRYWDCGEYLGLGAGAHSYFGGRRFSFKRDLEAYINALENVGSDTEIVDEHYEIAPTERIGEYVMLRLRLAEGVDTVEFERRFGLSFERLFDKYLDVYTENGFMQKRGNSYSLTLKGMYVSNYILSAMLDFDEAAYGAISTGLDK